MINIYLVVLISVGDGRHTRPHAEVDDRIDHRVVIVNAGLAQLHHMSAVLGSLALVFRHECAALLHARIVDDVEKVRCELGRIELATAALPQAIQQFLAIRVVGHIWVILFAPNFTAEIFTNVKSLGFSGSWLVLLSRSVLRANWRPAKL